MNSPNFKIARFCTKLFSRAVVFLLVFFLQVSVKAWDVDFSRREPEMRNSRLPASVTSVDVPGPAPATASSVLDGVLDAFDSTQDIVILNTEGGFVPATIKLKKDHAYKIYVVNINAKEKNASFIVDAFAEHHGTYFGEKNLFNISPKAEGVFSFQCPETAKQGHFVVIPDTERKPASE